MLTDREDELTSEVEHSSPVLRKRPSREASQEHQRESPRHHQTLSSSQQQSPSHANSANIHLSSSQNHLNGAENNATSGSHLHISTSQTYLTSPQNLASPQNYLTSPQTSLVSPHNSSTSLHNSTSSTRHSFSSPQNPTNPHNQSTNTQNGGERSQNQREVSSSQVNEPWSIADSAKYPSVASTNAYPASQCSPSEGEQETKFTTTTTTKETRAPPPTVPRLNLVAKIDIIIITHLMRLYPKYRTFLQCSPGYVSNEAQRSTPRQLRRGLPPSPQEPLRSPPATNLSRSEGVR